MPGWIPRWHPIWWAIFIILIIAIVRDPVGMGARAGSIFHWLGYAATQFTTFATHI